MRSLPKENSTGYRLVIALKERCKEDGKPFVHLAALLGLTKTYISSIGAGSKSIQPIAESREKRAKLAAFLGVSQIEVMGLAELLEPEDFVVCQSHTDRLNLAYESMSRDPMWASALPKPEAWEKSDTGLKTLAVLMYQAVQSQSMLKQAAATQTSRLEI
jgi:hypothetical protein